MNPMSAEANVVRTYIESVLSLPWGIYSTEQTDLEVAAEVLNEDHHGLKKGQGANLRAFGGLHTRRTDERPDLVFGRPSGKWGKPHWLNPSPVLVVPMSGKRWVACETRLRSVATVEPTSEPYLERSFNV